MNPNFFVIQKRPLSNMIVYWGISFMLIFGWIVEIIQHSLITNFFDLLFLILSISLYLRKSIYKKKFLLYFFLVLIYFFVSFFYATLFKNINPLDFLMAYKFTLYIILLLPFSNTFIIDSKSINNLLKLTLYMFSIVYVIKFLGGNTRPTFFIENNFEIMFLCFIFYANHILNKVSKMSDMFLLLFITVISGSRSGVILALLTLIFCTDIKSIIRTKNIFLPLAAFLGVFGAIFVFQKRSEGSIDSIDRYRFYQLFLESISDWTWVQYLFGADRITKLPNHVCMQLAYYESLLSFDNNDTCYSVIFHSFNMRVFYDHGILVILFLFAILNYILRKRTFKEKTLIFLLLIINGMSVSSINSVYAVLGIAIIASIPAKYHFNNVISNK